MRYQILEYCRNLARSKRVWVEDSLFEALMGHVSTIRRTRRNELRSAPQFRGINGVFVPNGALGARTIRGYSSAIRTCSKH